MLISRSRPNSTTFQNFFLNRLTDFFVLDQLTTLLTSYSGPTVTDAVTVYVARVLDVLRGNAAVGSVCYDGLFVSESNAAQYACRLGLVCVGYTHSVSTGTYGPNEAP